MYEYFLGAKTSNRSRCAAVTQSQTEMFSVAIGTVDRRCAVWVCCLVNTHLLYWSIQVYFPRAAIINQWKCPVSHFTSRVYNSTRTLQRTSMQQGSVLHDTFKYWQFDNINWLWKLTEESEHNKSSPRPHTSTKDWMWSGSDGLRIRITSKI